MNELVHRVRALMDELGAQLDRDGSAWVVHRVYTAADAPARLDDQYLEARAP
jgi:hypothetical protein